MQPIKAILRVLLPAALTSALLGVSAQAGVTVVTASGIVFQPANITINVGDTVRWLRVSGTHTVTEGTDGVLDGSEAFHSALSAGTPVFELVFDGAFLAANPRPGNLYNYHCIPHFAFGMLGTVTVNTETGTSFCDCSGGNSPCANGGAPGAGCQNSTGAGAVLGATGSADAVVDDIAFHGTGLPPNKPTLLFFGNAQVNGGAGSPFGDGLRCAGGSIQRLNVTVSSASGESHWGTGLNAGGLWNPGDTRFFQIWYRDPNIGPCGSDFNVSNGYQVLFN